MKLESSSETLKMVIEVSRIKEQAVMERNTGKKKKSKGRQLKEWGTGKKQQIRQTDSEWKGEDKEKENERKKERKKEKEIKKE